MELIKEISVVWYQLDIFGIMTNMAGYRHQQLMFAGNFLTIRLPPVLQN